MIISSDVKHPYNVLVLDQCFILTAIPYVSSRASSAHSFIYIAYYLYLYYEYVQRVRKQLMYGFIPYLRISSVRMISCCLIGLHHCKSFHNNKGTI